MFRSFSNLLEHIHHSFFFYVLVDNEHYVSIMNYIAAGALPIAALLMCFLFERSRLFLLRSISIFCLSMWINVVSYRLFLKSPSSIAPLVLALPAFALSIIYRWVAPKSVKRVICLIGAVSLTAEIFLNFGLAVLLGLFYGPIVVFSRPQSLLWTAICIACSPAMIFILLFITGNPWADFLSTRLETWNAGIPFLVWQPLLLLATAGQVAGPKTVKK